MLHLKAVIIISVKYKAPPGAVAEQQISAETAGTLEYVDESTAADGGDPATGI